MKTTTESAERGERSAAAVETKVERTHERRQEERRRHAINSTNRRGKIAADGRLTQLSGRKRGIQSQAGFLSLQRIVGIATFRSSSHFACEDYEKREIALLKGMRYFDDSLDNHMTLPQHQANKKELKTSSASQKYHRAKTRS
ncbi:hypothetical protein L596_018196 [Steinernema carpocapsae]|uniref:Uncharacterized protein n=1 Tax=Steinernema carpocapsae TaxID=34508 RepID=A0A4U5N3Y3_STECR|nr:hypothetical protein L596_018196 [Steinernema carpocapsae]